MDSILLKIAATIFVGMVIVTALGFYYLMVTEIPEGDEDEW